MPEDEINLVNYIKVIFHQKWLILIIAFVVLVFGIVFNMGGNKQYKNDLVLQIGQVNIYKNGAPSNFTPEAPFQIEEKVKNDLYDVDSSKVTDVEVLVSEDESTKKQSDIITISATSKSPKALDSYLEQIGEAIINEHKEKLKTQENYLEKIISTEKEKLEALDRSSDLSALQYLYVEDTSRIDDAEMSLNSIDYTKVLRNPSDELVPQKNNLLMKSLIFLVIGLFLGVALAFFREFFEKNKDFLKE